MSKLVGKILGGVLALLLCGSGAAFAYHYWPRRISGPRISGQQVIALSADHARVYVPQRVLVGEIANFDDGLFAFLMYDYLRGRPQLSDRQLMLVSKEQAGQPVYHLLVRLPSDLIEGIDILADLQESRIALGMEYSWIVPANLSSYLKETSVFAQAFATPVSWRLRALSASELQGYVRRFLRFKSNTDPRISRALEPVPSPLTRTDASRLAADIISVSHFYDLPIDLLLGIGAMENNYMNVAGDLKNTAWKKRARPGDVVLKRSKGRVLIQNDSLGVWQITRETLHYANRLYLADKRDYSTLPPRLLPPRKLDFHSIEPEVLTTYAGLLLRNLLDRFHGDVTLAAGAYNGGPGNPNAHYAAGVEMVASYARRVIGRAAELSHIAIEQSSPVKQPDRSLSAKVTKVPPLTVLPDR